MKLQIVHFYESHIQMQEQKKYIEYQIDSNLLIVNGRFEILKIEEDFDKKDEIIFNFSKQQI